jgi:suppressor of G2 allele of SKP1
MGSKEAADTASSLYSQGNEAFVNEDYRGAIELYSGALTHHPLFADALVARAHALIKTDQYGEAKKDADKAIDILRGGGEQSVSPLISKAFLRSGVASFHLGRYRESRNCFMEAEKVGSEAGLKQWMSWCDEKIAKFGDFAPGVKAVPVKDNKTDDAKARHEAETVQPEPQTASSSEMPVPKISHDWYQTETHVVVEVRIKKLTGDLVKVDMGDTTLSVTAKLPTGSEYSLELDLAHPILPLQSSYKILSTKIEIKLKKNEGVRWACLEGDGSAPLPGGGVALPSAIKGPYASGRDWAAIEKNLAKEAEEKKEGEAALNEMFQKIYADASDDVKRAMNKSFQESGGTVLSTNWNEIGKEKTEVKPPDGMEWKKWD